MCVCVCMYLQCRPCVDTKVELHQCCEDSLYLRGQESRPHKFDLKLVGLLNYAHYFHTATVLGEKNLYVLCVLVCRRAFVGEVTVIYCVVRKKEGSSSRTTILTEGLATESMFSPSKYISVPPLHAPVNVTNNKYYHRVRCSATLL